MEKRASRETECFQEYSLDGHVVYQRVIELNHSQNAILHTLVLGMKLTRAEKEACIIHEEVFGYFSLPVALGENTGPKKVCRVQMPLTKWDWERG